LEIKMLWNIYNSFSFGDSINPIQNINYLLIILHTDRQ